MSLISISNLTFSYEGGCDTIFNNVSLQLDTDWKLGLTGRNGRGKTTFLKLLAGRLEHHGSICSPEEFDYFPFDVGDPSQSVADVLEGISPGCEPWRIKKELSLLKVRDDALLRSFESLSRGEQTKVLLAALFLRDNRYPLIDEPTNHLDLKARELVGDYLNGKAGFILVSHDRSLLDRCVDHILSINRADIELQKGNYTAWLINRERQDLFETAEADKLKKDIRRLNEAANRASGWSEALEKTKYGTLDSGLKPDRGYIGHKAAKMMKRAKAAEKRCEKAAEEKTRLLKNTEASEKLFTTPLRHHSDRLIELRGAAAVCDGKRVSEPVSFSICAGERVALRGDNGCGKTSLIRMILNRGAGHTGSVFAAGSLVVSYVSQDTSFLRGGLKQFAAQNRIDESLFKAILRKLDFSRNQFEKDMSDFSEGQKKKTLIAKSLCEKAHLYIWDEPLNYVDVLSRMQIEDFIMSSKPAMLFVEHDRAFVDRVATGVVEMRPYSRKDFC